MIARYSSSGETICEHDRFAAITRIGGHVFLFVLLGLIEREAFGQNKAYFFSGDLHTSSYTKSVVEAAAKRYADAGWEVCIDLEMSGVDFDNAIKDPNAGVLWYIGHGTKVGSKAFGTWEESISYISPIVGGGKEQAYIDSRTVNVPENSNLKEVIFHACGQSLDSWRAKFAGTEFFSWSGYAFTAIISAWEDWTHEIPAPGEQITPSPPPPAVDPATKPENEAPFLVFPEGRKMVRTVFNNWALTGPLLDDYGADQSFNLFLSGDKFDQPQLLFGANVLDGLLSVDSTSDGVDNPSYNVVMPYEAFDMAYRDRSTWTTAYVNGTAEVDVYDMNLTPAVAFEAIGALLLGADAGVRFVPEPSAPAILLPALSILLFGRILIRRRGGAALGYAG